MVSMDRDLHRDVLSRLQTDYNFKHRSGSEWLQDGTCPSCKKKELFASADAPWKLWCGRKSKCAWEGYVKELYEDLFQSWSDRYPSTTESPLAAADAYLVNARGFQIDRLRGTYTQEYYHDRELNMGSATVRFALPGDCGFWERIIDRPQRFGKKKANFAYGKSYRGHAWVPPVTLIDVAKAEEVWITEGIFDAIALCLAGTPAISAMSTSNYPNVTLERMFPADTRRPKLVWALDGDGAGREKIIDYTARSRREGWHASAAVIPQTFGQKKIDWNEAYQRSKLTEADLERYRHEGSLLVATSTVEKARLIYRFKGYKSFWFEFNDCQYWFELNEARYEKARQALQAEDESLSEEELRDEALKQAGSIEQIAWCHPVPLYFQRNIITEDAQYFFRVSSPGQEPAKAAFRPEHVSAPAQFETRLLGIMSGAYWSGSKEKMVRIYAQWLNRLKTVETIDFIGYCKEQRAYVFGNVAIKDGRVVELNDEDYFELNRKTNIKTTSSVHHAIVASTQGFNRTWPALIHDVYGAKGLVALTFWFASLFAEQVREKQESFPFFELVGEGGSGKTSLVTFLNRLTGRPLYEGFDPSKATAAGRARTFVQVANMPVVLMEGDRGDEGAKAMKFDFDELKSLYNGRSTRTTGVKSGGNETHEPPFRGAIVIEQNRPVKAEDAVMQRICHVFMTREGHTPEGKLKSDKLNAMTSEELSHFVVASAQAEAQVMELFLERMPVYEAELSAHPEVRSVRLAKNHAQLMAMAEALELVVPEVGPYRKKVLDELTRMTVNREKVIGSDHPIVRQFWERFYELNGDGLMPYLNHSTDPGLIAVNLNEWLTLATQRWRDVPTLTELHDHLPASKSHKFVEASRLVHSAIRNKGKTPAVHGDRSPKVRCWIFRRSSIKDDE